MPSKSTDVSVDMASTHNTTFKGPSMHILKSFSAMAAVAFAATLSLAASS
jgi:hypothetical protein